MSAFSFPGDPSSMASPPSAPTPRVMPTPPAAPNKLPRPPGRPGAPAAVLDSTLAEGQSMDSAPRRAPSAPGRAEPSELEEWQSVFQDFVGLKQQCGENTDGFSYEKFELTLKKKNEELLTRHGAKRVKFSVYVKEGKAALKASPIMD
jgi:hypothetical protein